MNEANLGAEAVIPMHEAYAHPQLMANGMVVQVDDPDLGLTTQIGVPVTLSRTPGRITGPRPLPGQHNDEVLGRGRGAGTCSGTRGRVKRPDSSAPTAS